MFEVLNLHEKIVVISLDSCLLFVLWSPFVIIIIPWPSILLKTNRISKFDQLFSNFAFFVTDLLSSQYCVGMSPNQTLKVFKTRGSHYVLLSISISYCLPNFFLTLFISLINYYRLASKSPHGLILHTSI